MLRSTAYCAGPIIIFLIILSAPLLSNDASTATLPSLTVVQRLSLPPNVTGLAWNFDGSKLATFSDDTSTITIWDARDWRVVREFRRNSGGYVGNDFAWLPDGKILTPAAPTNVDEVKFSLSLWNSQTGTLVHNIVGFTDEKSLQHNQASVFAVSRDGSIVAMANYMIHNQIVILDTRTWAVKATLVLTPSGGMTGLPTALAFDSDNRLAVGTTAGNLEIFNLKERVSERIISAFSSKLARNVNTAAFSPNNDFIAAAPTVSATRQPLDGNPVRVWKSSSGERIAALASNGPDDTIPQIAWSADGNLLSVINSNGWLNVWRLSESPNSILQMHFSGDGFATSFSPRGLLAVATGSQVVVLQ